MWVKHYETRTRLPVIFRDGGGDNGRFGTICADITARECLAQLVQGARSAHLDDDACICLERHDRIRPSCKSHYRS